MPRSIYQYQFINIDCMHVASQEGEYIYKKASPSVAMAYESDLEEIHGNSVQMIAVDEPSVCGFYVVADPYKTVEISFNHLDASCESGALLGVSQRIPSWTVRINCNSFHFVSLSMAGN